MMDNEKIKEYAFTLLRVYKYTCKNCKNTYVQAVSTSDTDMVPIFLGSVYALNPETLVIAELTADEYQFGWLDRMPKRISQFFDGREFFGINYHNICPVCSSTLEESQGCKLEQYLQENPNVYLIYSDSNQNLQEKIFYKSILKSDSTDAL